MEKKPQKYTFQIVSAFLLISVFLLIKKLIQKKRFGLVYCENNLYIHDVKYCRFHIKLRCFLLQKMVKIKKFKHAVLLKIPRYTPFFKKKKRTKQTRKKKTSQKTKQKAKQNISGRTDICYLWKTPFEARLYIYSPMGKERIRQYRYALMVTILVVGKLESNIWKITIPHLEIFKRGNHANRN